MKRIPGFSDYLINADGEVFTTRKCRRNHNDGSTYKLKHQVFKKGYRYIRITGDDGTAKTKKISRLVLETFIGKCPEGMEACHNNCESGDDRLENLRWDTRKNNKADTIRIGRAKIPALKGEQHPKSKLNATQARIIKSYFNFDRERGVLKFLSSCFDVDRQTIADIRDGKSWKQQSQR